MRLIRYTEQPDLWEDTGAISHEVWPEYNQHGEVMNAYWGRLFEDFPAYQFVLWEDEVLGEGHSVPCHWDGTPDGLGDGIDAMVIAAFEAHETERAPNALCALAAEIMPRLPQPPDRAMRAERRASDKLRARLRRTYGVPRARPPLLTGARRRRTGTPGGRVAEARDPRPSPARRSHRQAGRALPADHRNGGRMGAVDGHALPGRRRLHVPARARPGRDRSRSRHRGLPGAERLGRSSGRDVLVRVRSGFIGTSPPLSQSEDGRATAPA
jgi:hypothetical protein